MFKFPKAQRRAPEVQAWLDGLTGETGSVARTWFGFIRALGEDVREVMHDGYATACINDAAFAYVGVFKAHVNVGFFHGATLPDPAGLLQGTGLRMRHVKVKPGVTVDVTALEALIVAAREDIVTRTRTTG